MITVEEVVVEEEDEEEVGVMEFGWMMIWIYQLMTMPVSRIRMSRLKNLWGGWLSK